MSWVAFVDESAHRPHHGEQAGSYIMAAVMVELSHCGMLRDVVRPLRVSGRRFHWRHEQPQSKTRAVETLADQHALHVVIIGAPLDRREERARRQCLERLLFELESAGIERVFLESRSERLNRQDYAAVAAFRARQVLTRIRIDHLFPEGPNGEPLLWIPDVVAGAVAAELGGNPKHLEILAHLTERHYIHLK